MKKKNYFYSVFAIMMAAVMSVGFTACGGDDGGDSGNPDQPEPASITVNGSTSTDLQFLGEFGSGKSGIDYKLSVAITSNTQWSATKDADWLSVSPSNGGKGTIEMTIYPISENMTSIPRKATVTISGGGVSVTVNVTQDPGRPLCYVEPQNVVALYNRMAWEYKATGNVNKFQFILLTESELKRMTDKEITEELGKKEALKVVDDYLTTIGSDFNGNSIKENTTYYIVTIAYNEEDKAGELKKTKIETPKFLDENQDAYVSFPSISYYNNWAGFTFDVKKEGYCNTYHIIYGLYHQQVNSVVHAFEINYFIKNKKKHWLAEQMGWEIVLNYPNDHTFNYYSTSLPAEYQSYVSLISWAFASGWGVFSNGTISSDLIGFQFDLSNYMSAPNMSSAPMAVTRRSHKDEILEERTYSKSELVKNPRALAK